MPAKTNKKIFTKLDGTNSRYIKIALAVIGIFAAIIAMLGALFKKIGECANRNAALRHKCLSQLHQIFFIITGNKVVSGASLAMFLLSDNVLLKAKADAQTVAHQFSANVLTQYQDINLLKQIAKQYLAVWDQIKLKQQNLDLHWEIEEAQLTHLTSTSPETQQATLTLLHTMHAELVKKEMLNESITKYNQARQQMTGTPVAVQLVHND